MRKRAHSSDDDVEPTLTGSIMPDRQKLQAKKTLATTSFTSRSRLIGTETSIVAELDGVASIAGMQRQIAGGAFATSEIDTELDRDGRALYEKQMALQELARGVVVSDKKLYRGQAGYTNFIQKDGARTLRDNDMADEARVFGWCVCVRVRVRACFKASTLVNYKRHCGLP